MSDKPHTDDEMKVRLWKEIEKARYGMLGLTGAAPGRHFQPMTAFAEPDDGALWFFTQSDTDLARDVAAGADAMFIVQAKDQEFQACVGGRLSQDQDRARIDRYWNPVVAAWYPAGKDDPKLTLLRFDARDAQVWLSEQGPLKFGFEIARANVTGREPDVGESRHVEI